MKWELETIDQYVQAREYIDTALVPLIRIEAGESIAGATEAAHFTLAVATAIEAQLKGRILLFPAFSFVQEYSDELLASALNTYAEHVKQSHLKNVVFLTQSSWVQERELSNIAGDILKVSEDRVLNEEDPQAAVLQESEKLVKLFIQIWNR